MIPVEKNKIAQWGQKLPDNVRIDLILTADRRAPAFSDFCDHLTGIAPKVRIKREKEDDSGPPVIRFGNVSYQAIPTGKELDPFLNALAGEDRRTANLPASIFGQLAEIQIPAPLKIYITPLCPFCPTVVSQLLALAGACEFLKITVIDGVLFPEIAASDNIQSAPTVLLDDQYRWTGSIQIREVVDMLLNRDPAGLSAASLRSMMEEGHAAGVAEMMLASETIFPAFLELAVHEKWPVRLGAMVTFETIAAQNSALAARAVPFLWEHFAKADDTVKGDILYLLGISEYKKICSKIKSVLSGPYHADVKEAAAEALNNLNCESSDAR